MTEPTNIGIIALPFEISTTFNKGTVHGPSAILDELEHLDTFDFNLKKDTLRSIPKTTIQPHGLELIDARIQQLIAARTVEDVLNADGFPISLGGEHTVTLGPVRACRSRGTLGVIQMDAHADLRDSYDGNPLSHACVMRRVIDLDCPTLGVGIRSMSEDEAHFIQKHNIKIVSAQQVIATDRWYSKIDALPNRIYLTIDMDFFDPADVPAVGTPEPGGPSWYNMINFLTHLFSQKEVVAADIVELMPGLNDDASVRLAARLVGTIASLRFKNI